MPDKIFIQKKLDLLEESIANLEELVVAGFISEIKTDKLKLAAIERYFQLAVDQMVDINTHLIKTGDFGTVDDFQSTFILLGKFNVLDKDFAVKIAPIVGVRNMLVHRYEKLDKDMFLSNLQNHFSDFKNYAVQIDSYIRKN